MTGRRKLNIVRSAIGLMGERISEKNIPMALRDLTRLVRLESEMSDRDAVRSIEVSWIPDKQPDGRPYPAESLGDDLGNRGQQEQGATGVGNRGRQQGSA